MFIGKKISLDSDVSYVQLNPMFWVIVNIIVSVIDVFFTSMFHT